MLLDMRLGGVNSRGPRLGQGYIVRSSSLRKAVGGRTATRPLLSHRLSLIIQDIVRAAFEYITFTVRIKF
jgi:hypothetical protein